MPRRDVPLFFGGAAQPGWYRVEGRLALPAAENGGEKGRIVTGGEQAETGIAGG